MRRFILGAVAAGCTSVFGVTQALACGGLVAPDGDVHLDEATTFVAWHGGVEHYVTSFAYSGSAADVGWIVPLPAVPDRVEAAGRWTLQRLEREFNPPPELALSAGAAAPVPASSVVVEQVQVEALDITVLKGSGQAVIDWCVHNGFLLPPDTQNHLLRYAQGNPVFMAAKYDSAAAQQRGLRSGDGVPLLITMRTPQLWVPLEVLANDNDTVNADVFLLTDGRLQPAQITPLVQLPPFAIGSTGVVDGASGLTIAAQREMTPLLHTDLSGDRNMSWVPDHGWLTYLRLSAPSTQVTYDLGVGGDDLIRLASFGTAPGRVTNPDQPDQTGFPFLWLVISAAAIAVIALAAGTLALRRRRA